MECSMGGLDVTDSEAVAAFVEAVKACFSRIDICLTNSGGPPSKCFKSTRPEDSPAALECDGVKSLLQCNSNGFG